MLKHYIYQDRKGCYCPTHVKEVEIYIFFPISTLNNAVKSHLHSSLFPVAKYKTDLLPVFPFFFPPWYDLSCTPYLNCCFSLILI